ncbi:hypothetical protein FJY70_04230, partial [candidate division WOR-3 bacterium]|nr:hypothetical protein [candidate division WOR-3 bacterium]
VISVSDPSHPVELGYYDTPGYAYGVHVSGNHAYVADASAGLQVIEFYGTGVQEMMNDERGTMNVGATIIRGVVNLEAYSRQHTAYGAELMDISGRRALDLKPGANDVSRLGSGVYFVMQKGLRGQGFVDSSSRVVITK